MKPAENFVVSHKEFNFEKISCSETKQEKVYSLDEFQKAAAENLNNQLLIVAGPGSGKTTVLTRRIANLISENNIPADNCLAITFTRRAADEMRRRLEKLISGKAAEINIHTFHSLCFEILKENYKKAGLSEDFGVISEQEKALYEQIPDNMVEFDDLIRLTVKLFEENPDIKEFYRLQYKYVSVDEYQDIDENQYKLIKLLVPPNGNICAIGDPNQAIYGFRGGSAKFFNNFAGDFENVHIINLKNNYRSSQNIVNASNQMIDTYNIVAHNNRIYDKITIHTAPTDNAEAEFVVSTIENLIGGHSFFSIDSDRSDGEKNNYTFSDFAILYRTSAQLKSVIKALERSGMPFVKLSNDMLCDKTSVKKLLKNLSDDRPVLDQLKENLTDDTEDYIRQYLFKTAESFPDKKDFIHEISLIKESDTLDERADRISLMTLHSSKGLEFGCVFIIGLENGILPINRAQTPEEIEEERRLLYVGMTRAKERLFLSRAVKRNMYGKTEHLEISPFLAKIEQDLLEYSRFEKEYKEQQKSAQLSLF